MITPDVYFVPERSRGTARIRAWWPAEVMRAQGIDARCAVEEDATRAPMDIPTMLREVRPKVAVIHQTATWYKHELVAGFKARGARVIVSEDDAFWLWPHGGTTRARIDAANQEAAARSNGRDLRLMAVTERAAREADRIVVTTDHLADLFGVWNPDVRVVPNYLPAWVGQVEPVKQPDDMPAIGFRGTVGAHLKDLEWIKAEAREMFRGCRLVEVGGGGDVARFLGWKGPRTDWPFTHDPRELYARLAGCDLAFVPLDPDLEWNEAKSWLGGLEWASVGVPVVATRTRDHAKLGERLPGLRLVDTPVLMRSEVRGLVENPALRRLIVRDHVKWAPHQSLETRASEVIDSVRDLL